MGYKYLNLLDSPELLQILATSTAAIRPLLPNLGYHYCDQSMSVVLRAAPTIALKAYSSYTPGPLDSKLGRKHRGDL